jgi:uncharacterized repeat protein (TIGR01451 family)
LQPGEIITCTFTSHTVELFQPSINVTKTGPDYSSVGDVVTYMVSISNTSSEDTPNLSLVSFSDSLVAGLTPPAGCDDLGYQGTCSVEYTYTVQPGDDSGEVGAQLVNTAIVVYSPDGFPNELDASDSHSVEMKPRRVWLPIVLRSY